MGMLYNQSAQIPGLFEKDPISTTIRQDCLDLINVDIGNLRQLIDSKQVRITINHIWAALDLMREKNLLTKEEMSVICDQAKVELHANKFVKVTVYVIEEKTV